MRNRGRFGLGGTSAVLGIILSIWAWAAFNPRHTVEVFGHLFYISSLAWVAGLTLAITGAVFAVLDRLAFPAPGSRAAAGAEPARNSGAAR